MKSTISLIVMHIVITMSLNAQSFTQTITICNLGYTATCEIQADNSLKVEIKDGLNGSKKESNTITTDNLEVFASNFAALFKKVNTSCSDDGSIVSAGRNFFLSFKTSLADSSSPVAGIFKVYDKIKLQKKVDSNKAKYEDEDKEYKIEKVQVEINNGYIENIEAFINVNGKIYTYTTAIPVGISSVRNFTTYESVQLFENSDPFKSAYSVRLGRLINYEYKYAVDRRDYSPQDTAFTILGGQAVTLHKQKTNKLFEARIFTDFVGLKEEKPNGLIQTEISKRININSVQHLLKWKPLYNIVKSYGLFQHISPTITFSKIEQHNKGLLLGDMDSIRFNPGTIDTSRFEKTFHRYVTALDLYQYQSFSAGAVVNLFFLSNHDLKYTLYINMGGRFGITPVIDSLTEIEGTTITKTGYANTFNVNSIQFYPEFSLTFLPEERFNFSITDRMIYITPVNPNIQELSFYKYDYGTLTSKTDKWINSIELLMTIQTNPNSKLFARLKFNSAMKNINNNFAQIQVGYSTYILGK